MSKLIDVVLNKILLAMSTDVERLFSHGGLNVMKHCHNLLAESTIDQTVLNSCWLNPVLCWKTRFLLTSMISQNSRTMVVRRLGSLTLSLLMIHRYII